MSTHPFLQKQGIEVAPPYMKINERLNQKLLVDHGLDLGNYDPFQFPTIIGSYSCDFVQLKSALALPFLKTQRPSLISSYQKPRLSPWVKITVSSHVLEVTIGIAVP